MISAESLAQQENNSVNVTETPLAGFLLHLWAHEYLPGVQT